MDDNKNRVSNGKVVDGLAEVKKAIELQMDLGVWPRDGFSRHMRHLNTAINRLQEIRDKNLKSRAFSK